MQAAAIAPPKAPCTVRRNVASIPRCEAKGTPALGIRVAVSASLKDSKHVAALRAHPIRHASRSGDARGSQKRRASPRATILFAFAVAAGIALTVLAARVLLTLFAGVLFAVVLRAWASFAERRVRLPYRAALALGVALIFACFGLGFYFALPALVDQVRGFGGSLPTLLERLGQTLHLPLSGALGSKPQDIATNVQKLAGHAAAALGTSVEVFGGFVVVFFVGVYGAASPPSYAKILLWLAPPTKKPLVRRILERATENLERWLLGRLVAMAFVGIASGIVFAVLGIPLAFPLAVLAGLLTFVEYVGAFASAVPPILLALSESPTHALWVALAFTVLHVIEGYVLTPLLAKRAVDFPPATTLASQALLGTLLGPLGLTFATPLMVVAVTAVQEWVNEP